MACLCLKKATVPMGMSNGPDHLLHSLTVLRPSEAKRQFRKTIFEDYPLRGPLGQPACAYCGKWHEKLTLDHIVPKSKGGAHFAKWNLAPACKAHNIAKSNLPVFEWWRPLECWSEEREQLLLSWVQSNSFISAYTDIGQWEETMETRQRVWPVHGRTTEKAPLWTPAWQLCLAG